MRIQAGTMAAVKNLNKHPNIHVTSEVQFFTFCWGFGVKWYDVPNETSNVLKFPHLLFVVCCLLSRYHDQVKVTACTNKTKILCQHCN